MSSTKKSQRIAIIIIAIVMTIGTVGSFFVIIVANNNQRKDIASQQKQQEEQRKKLMEQYKEMQKKQDELSKKLSPKYYPILKKYKSTPSPFDSSKVKKLEVKNLRKGKGDKAKTLSDINVFYIGWNPSGKVFDSSFDSGDKLKPPLDPSMGLIEGFEDGIKNMKVGEVREITIPADKAYGDNPPENSGISKNSPLKFIVLAIPPQDI